MWLWVIRIAVLFLVLTVAYLALSAYMRWGKRRALEAEYEAAVDRAPDRETFVAEGLETYDRSLRKKLLLGIYGIPLLTVAVLIALAQLG